MSNLPSEIWYAAVAMAGGFAKYVHDSVTHETFNVWKAIAQIIISGFSGLMLSWFMSTLGVNGKGLFLAAGIGGWMGVQALDVVSKRVLK